MCETQRIFDIINNEKKRQTRQIEMIASENIVSENVLRAVGSVLTNKYAEGYPGKRYYGGCEFVDEIESIAIDGAKKLFGCNYANVQPHSGAQANLSALFACLSPNDTILGMNLASGGHLTHGAKPTISGKWFQSVSYDVEPETSLIDYNVVEILAKEYRPKLIIAGASAYPRIIDFAKFKEIAEEVGAILMCDVAHYAGLIVAGEYPSPFPFADIVTSTTHKTLRGPRGGLILTNDEEMAKKVNKAVFPGVQGGPLMHIIAGKAVAFAEALTDDFKKYAHQMIVNARSLAEALINAGINILTNGTDSHMVIIDLRNLNVNGREVEIALDEIGITCNKNAIPNDPLPPSLTSGIRLGTPAGTTRGMDEQDFKLVGEIIADVIFALNEKKLDDTLKLNLKKKVQSITDKLASIPVIK